MLFSSSHDPNSLQNEPPGYYFRPMALVSMREQAVHTCKSERMDSWSSPIYL